MKILDLVGTTLGKRYEILDCLGSGSLALVYRARDLEAGGLDCALKVLFPELSATAEGIAWIRHDFTSCQKVDHPNVVTTYDLLQCGDLIGYTMELAEGGDLSDRLTHSPSGLPIPEVVSIILQLCGGLQAIHDADLMHCNLKPENVLVFADGGVKIGDFHIARGRHGERLFDNGKVSATIDYVAPEYIEFAVQDWRSDIFGLGMLAFELTTGRSPFASDSLFSTMMKRIRSEVIAPSKLRADCPKFLDDIVLRALHKDPVHRFQSAQEIVEELQELAERDFVEVASPVGTSDDS